MSGRGLQVIEQVLVNVNGDILTRRQLDERVRSVLAQQQGRAVAPAQLRTDPAVRRQAAALTPRVVADAIDEILVLQRARELGFDVDEDDVDRVVARMRLDNNIGSDEEFTGLLRAQGILPDALRESVRNQILIEEVRQDVFRRIQVTVGEAETYYHSHKDEFSGGPAVAFREIFVALPALDTARAPAAVAREYDQRLIRFVSAQDRVRNGEDFGAVAREVSDAASKDAGGAVDSIDPQALPEAVRAALAKLSVGEVSAPVRTEHGYWVLKLEGVSPPQPATFATFRARVLAELLARKQATAFADHLKRLRQRALLNWKDLALKAAYEELSVNR